MLSLTGTTSVLGTSTQLTACTATYMLPTVNGKGHSAHEGLIGRSHSQVAMVYHSIGGWSLSDHFPVMSASAAARRNFAKNCVGLIREYNFDRIGERNVLFCVV